MTASDPLRADQLKLVLEHAAAAPRLYRAAWMLNLADQLIGVEVTDEALRSAITNVDRLILGAPA